MAGGSGANAGDDTPPAWVVDLFGLFVDSFLEITKLESRPVSKVPSIRGPGEGHRSALRNMKPEDNKATVTNISEILHKMSTKIINMLKEEMKNKQNTDKQVPSIRGPGEGHRSALRNMKPEDNKDQKTPAWVTKMSKFNKAMFIAQFEKLFDEMKKKAGEL